MINDRKENHSVLLDEPPEDLSERITPEQPLVLAEAEAAGNVKQPQVTLSSSKSQSVTVAPNLSEVVTGKLELAEDEHLASQTQKLNEVVHHILIVGLALSTVMILIGLGLDLANHRQVPTDVPGFRETFRRAASLRASGFLTLGLLVLVATPILRVLGSTLAFLYERDWRYAAITFLVLVIVSLSLLLGQG